MSITNSPSDYTAIAPSYGDGYGYYTDYKAVADLLQLPHFDSSATYPTRAMVGSIIKKIEGMVDDKVKRSFRPIITQKEFHNFEYRNNPGLTLYGGYVGFIQLKQMKVRKVVSLLVWSGSGYKEIASAQAGVTLLENYRDMYSLRLVLPNTGVYFELIAEDDNEDVSNSEFCTTFGIKTTNSDLTALINESFPSTSLYTRATAAKSLTGKKSTNDSTTSLAVSDFFFAQKEEGNGANVLISSLLSGDDGADCVLQALIKQSCTTANADATLTVADSSKLAVGMVVTGTNIASGTTTITSITDSTHVELSANSTGAATSTITFTTTSGIPTVCTLSNFTDKEDMKRTGDYWLLNEEGRIFFLQDYPYHTRNSVIVSYISGNARVPSAIHDATTKLVAAEILRHDDQSVLITETGANIGTKEKYDILRTEAMETLKGKADIVYLIE